MNRVVKAAFWAFWPILFLVIIPRVILDRASQTTLPHATMTLTSQITLYTGIDFSAFVTGLNIIGVALAVLSAVQTYSNKWSIIKPLSSSLHMITSWVLLLYVIGIGNVRTLGVATISYTNGTSLLTVDLILRFLALLAGIAVVLKIVQKTMKWREDVRNHRLEMGTQVRPGTTR